MRQSPLDLVREQPPDSRGVKNCMSQKGKGRALPCHRIQQRGSAQTDGSSPLLWGNKQKLAEMSRGSGHKGYYPRVFKS